MHNKSGFYERLYLLINGLFIYSENLTLAVLSMPIYSEIVFVDMLDLFLVLIFPSGVNLVAHLQLLF